MMVARSCDGDGRKGGEKDAVTAMVARVVRKML